jgi:transposase InsO family protein
LAIPRGGQVPGLIMHTDCSSEYTRATPVLPAGALQIRHSMGRPGSALDNAVIEAWHSTLCFELRSRETFATKAAGRARIRSGSMATTGTGDTPRAAC